MALKNLKIYIYLNLQVDFPSGRFIRIDIQPKGFSLTLQTLGMDFKNSEGLCGNFDGIPLNDLSDVQIWKRQVIF